MSRGLLVRVGGLIGRYGGGCEAVEGGFQAGLGVSLIGRRGRTEQEKYFPVACGSGEYGWAGVAYPDLLIDKIPPKGFQCGGAGTGRAHYSVEAVFGGTLELGFGEGQDGKARGELEKPGGGSSEFRCAGNGTA